MWKSDYVQNKEQEGSSTSPVKKLQHKRVHTTIKYYLRDLFKSIKTYVHKYIIIAAMYKFKVPLLGGISTPYGIAAAMI